MSGLPEDLYDRARLLGAPGVEATIRLNPIGWSTRMRNAVVKALRTGVVPGGWRSDARKISQLILEARQLQYVRNDGWNIHVKTPLVLPDAARKKAVELLTVDYTAYRLSDGAHEYTTTNKKETINRMQDGDMFGYRECRTHYFSLMSPYDKEFAELIASSYPERENKERNKLADDIVAGRTIIIQE
jgi:hypothetical protein